MTIINDQQASELTNLIDQPQQAQRTFSTAKAFHGYISKEYQIQCSYETVVRFFHKQGYALKTQKRLKKLPVSERYYDKRSNRQTLLSLHIPLALDALGSFLSHPGSL
jgi:transposase